MNSVRHQAVEPRAFIHFIEVRQRLTRIQLAGAGRVANRRAIDETDARINYRILVVDDNRDAADSLAALLEGLGASARAVYDGHAALAALDDFKADVVFLDLGMPGLDGFAVARRIREREDLRDVALVAVTGWGQQQDRTRTQAAGFDRHLVKPIDPPKIHAVLASVTRQRARTLKPPRGVAPKALKPA